MSAGVEAFVATRQQLVGDMVPKARPESQRRTAEELGVVWMCQDHQDVLRGVPGIHSAGRFRLEKKWSGLRFTIVGF
jgi:hypothetical protein